MEPESLEIQQVEGESGDASDTQDPTKQNVSETQKDPQDMETEETSRENTQDHLAKTNNKDVDRAKSASRIRELNAIDQDVTRSLQAAGEAIKSLTDTAPSTDADGDGEMSPLEASKKAFETHTNEYYTLVQSISARLRRQIYALEEAGIIAPNQASTEHQTAPPAPASRPVAAAKTTGARTGTTAAAMLQQRAEPPMEITNGGLGNFDVGWLNSRSDKVGRQMEAELWAQARAKLEEMKKENGDSGEAKADENDGMDVDETET